MNILMAFGDYMTSPERKKQNTYGGVGYYRTIKPSEQIKSHDVKVIGKEITAYGNSPESQWDTIFQEFDVFWTSYFADSLAGALITYHTQKHKKKFIVDVDDNYLDVPPSNPIYDKFKPGKRDRAMLSTILSFADALTVSTEPLRERLYDHIRSVHGIEKPIFVIPNMNDLKDWDFPQVERRTDRITIGYSGSNSHHDDLLMVLPSIAEVMKKHKNVHVELVGMIEKKKIPLYFQGFDDDSLNRVALRAATPTFREYPPFLAGLQWDIGIAPLVDTPFTRSKSHIKWMEYAMYAIPTVASRVYPYFMDVDGRKTIEDGETGLLVRPKEWVDTLEHLIERESERKRLGKNAKAHVRKVWQYTDGNIDQTVREMLR